MFAKMGGRPKLAFVVLDRQSGLHCEEWSKEDDI